MSHASSRSAAARPLRLVVRRPSEVARNDEWDRLIGLARVAWEWRDPETLAALDACLQRLRVKIVREWSA